MNAFVDAVRRAVAFLESRFLKTRTCGPTDGSELGPQNHSLNHECIKWFEENRSRLAPAVCKKLEEFLSSLHYQVEMTCVGLPDMEEGEDGFHGVAWLKAEMPSVIALFPNPKSEGRKTQVRWVPPAASSQQSKDPKSVYLEACKWIAGRKPEASPRQRTAFGSVVVRLMMDEIVGKGMESPAEKMAGSHPKKGKFSFEAACKLAEEACFNTVRPASR